MERKFKEGDLVHKIGDLSLYYQVLRYEPHFMVSTIMALEGEKSLVPQSQYVVTCFWTKNGEREYIQFEESEITNSY